MRTSKNMCGECGRIVGVLKDGTLARHKVRKGSKDQTRCKGGRS